MATVTIELPEKYADEGLRLIRLSLRTRMFEFDDKDVTTLPADKAGNVTHKIVVEHSSFKEPEPVAKTEG